MEIDPEIIENTRGFLDPEEGGRLYELALSASRRGPCLEIGSYCGKSSLYLGSGCRKNSGILFSIDHHRGSEDQQPGEGYFDPDAYDPKAGRVDTFPLFRDTLVRAELEQTVVPIVSTSEAVARMWSIPLGLVFIDGGHTDEAAFTDYNAWATHVMPGGYLAIHDIFQTEAEGGQAPHRIYRLALASGLFAELPMTKTLGVLRRISGNKAPGFSPAPD
ncbi:MAG: class I SAM-dependent methyltransferase [Desulfobacterales bacterium]|nr:class I SAM-dependent methyltransferase [Desulfobacterales bacterium]MBS3755410.1 class I SAM-dependent methyltransferase [Desulfobacterales bacterium]